MKFLFFFISLLIFSNSFSQSCSLKSFKNKRTAKKINKLIENNDLLNAKLLLRSSKDHPVFNALKAEILWLEGDYVNAKKIANEVLYQCDEQFPVVYYLLAEILYQEKNFIESYSNLKKGMDCGLSGKYLQNAEVFLPKAKTLSDILNNPVEYNPRIIEGISTEFDEYLPAISPDQDYVLFCFLLIINSS